MNDFLVPRNEIGREKNKTVSWNSKKKTPAFGKKENGLGKVSSAQGKPWTLSRVSPGMPKDPQGKNRAQFRLEARRPEARSKPQLGWWP